MNPGDFNRELSALLARLGGPEERQIRMGAICGFLIRTRDEFEPREQWAQKAKLLFYGESAAIVRSLLSVDRLLNCTQAQLAELADALDEIHRLDQSVGELTRKVQTARILQWLYVGNLARAAELLGVPAGLSATGALPNRAEAFLSALSQHELAPHLKPYVDLWVARAGTRKLSAREALVLLVSPADGKWERCGVMSRLTLTHAKDTASHHSFLPENAAQAAVRWARERGYLCEAEQHRITLDDVEHAVEGNSHTLAAAALLAAQVEDRDNNWQHVGFPPLLAITGEVDAEGWVLSVDGLAEKLTRAFFSPVQVLAYPAAQARDAQELLAALEAQHPDRKLTLLPVWALADLLNPPVHGLRRKTDPLKWVLYRGSLVSNLIFAAASLLLLIAAVQLAMYAHPKLSPWFDWQPYFWDVRDGEHVVLKNKAGQQITSLKLDPPWRPGQQDDPYYSNLNTYLLTGGDRLDSVQKNRAINAEPGEMCQLADVNGDGQREAFFRCALMEDGDTAWHRTKVYCLELNSSALWFASDYAVKWERNFDRVDFAPLIGTEALYPAEVRGMTPIDWRGDGHANLILKANDCKPQNNSSAYLEELDGQTGATLGRFWHMQWFFGLCAVTAANGREQTLWAGAFNTIHATPELFIFHDSLRSRVWPCADTTGFRALRYPYSDVALAFDVPTYIPRISQDHLRKAEIRIIVGSLQHHVDESTDWRGYTFLLNHDAEWIGDSFERSCLPHLVRFEKDGYIKLPADIDDWHAPLTFAEQWTGQSWVPADTTRPRPVPYPIFEATDPRLQHPIKLPVRWQDLSATP